ncbi:MAG: glycosyltransferase family 4 protein [Synergistaceae bacterium]|nr:glycosyltransferase family 4 protein [Synergistaceae bacterium]
MKLVLVSNYLSHYSRTISEAFIRIYGGDFRFIAQTPFNQKRISSGFHDMNSLPFVLRAYESPEAMSEADRMIDEADCVIIAGLPVSVVSRRLKGGKITFMQSERFFKGPLWKDAVRFVKYSRYSGGRSQARSPQSKFYLLCAGAFANWDYHTCGLFDGKAYRWGYFTELKRHDIFPEKERASLIWTGRFMEEKHPELAVIVAKNLREMGLDFRMRMIGAGAIHGKISEMVSSLELSDKVELMGSLPTAQVRAEMEKSEIFLFTSDRWEGWGVVLNEAMNSGCACVAGGKIGSVPYLVKDGVNGLVFRDMDADDLTEKVAGLLRQPGRISLLGRNAYETVAGEWSPKTAAERFVRLSEALDRTAGPVSLWEDGPGSIAPVI